MNERFPQSDTGLSFYAPNEQALDGAAAGNPPAEQARRKNPGVIHYNEVARRQEIGQ